MLGLEGLLACGKAQSRRRSWGHFGLHTTAYTLKGSLGSEVSVTLNVTFALQQKTGYLAVAAFK